MRAVTTLTTDSITIAAHKCWPPPPYVYTAFFLFYSLNTQRSLLQCTMISYISSDIRTTNALALFKRFWGVEEQFLWFIRQFPGQIKQPLKQSLGQVKQLFYNITEPFRGLQNYLLGNPCSVSDIRRGGREVRRTSNKANIWRPTSGVRLKAISAVFWSFRWCEDDHWLQLKYNEA